MKFARSAPVNTQSLVEHYFRHEYGRVVAMLSCQMGMHYIEATEDAVQSALVKALESWTINGLPDNPSAWVYRVAKNELLGKIRQTQSRNQNLERYPLDALIPQDDAADIYMDGELKDELLLMLFVCCDETIPTESQLVFALKTLCGFSVSEIGHRLFISDANVYKRLSRARNRLQVLPSQLGQLKDEQYVSRLPLVHSILYLLFTEGYLSSHADMPIRIELCFEAIRLTTLLANHSVGQLPQTYALLALMHLHAARIEARQDDAGGLLLLEEQNRELWDTSRIQIGLWWLARSAAGEQISRYHAEAGIAAEHCLAESFSQTRWDRVCENYELLERIAPSAIHSLNRAVCLAELEGPQAGLAVLEGFEPPSWLLGSYQWYAVLGDLHRRCGNAELAFELTAQACKLAPTQALRSLIERRERS